MTRPFHPARTGGAGRPAGLAIRPEPNDLDPAAVLADLDDLTPAQLRLVLAVRARRAEVAAYLDRRAAEMTSTATPSRVKGGR